MNVDGVKSNWKEVISGIPQGSVLGPILFVLFINDLPDEIKFSICKLFADDCKLYGAVNVGESGLQKDLSNMEKWSRQWQLLFNASKCKVMHFGNNNQQQSYHLNNHTLEASNNEKDLGVIIDEKLKFHIHAASASKKANQMLGVIKRAYTSRDSSTICPLYKALVRPHLEYGNTIWGPFYREDIKIIESVQRRATKLITGFNNKPYEDRLRLLELPSLVYRRKRGDMIWMYKIMNGLVRVDVSKLFIPGKLDHTRGHSQRVFKRHAVKVPRSNCFSQRIVNDWNSLSSYVVEAPSLNTFKNRLDDYWQDLHYVTTIDI